MCVDCITACYRGFLLCSSPVKIVDDSIRRLSIFLMKGDFLSSFLPFFLFFTQQILAGKRGRCILREVVVVVVDTLFKRK